MHRFAEGKGVGKGIWEVERTQSDDRSWRRSPTLRRTLIIQTHLPVWGFSLRNIAMSLPGFLMELFMFGEVLRAPDSWRFVSASKVQQRH